MAYEFTWHPTKVGSVQIEWENAQALYEALSKRLANARWPELGYQSMKAARVVEPSDFPLRGTIRGRTKRPLPHMFYSTTYVISEQWKGAIEELEPGLHQFIPVEILDRQGRPIEQQFYYLNIMTALACLDPNGPDMVVSQRTTPTGATYTVYTKKSSVSGHYDLLSVKIRGYHLWHCEELMRTQQFMSGGLYRRLSAFKPHCGRSQLAAER